MVEFFINGFLVSLLAIIAVVAIRSIKIFTTVMLAGAYSLISAIIFVSLDAVDVAFTEALLEQEFQQYYSYIFSYLDQCLWFVKDAFVKI